MKNNFDLKKYLVENKTTRNSKILKEMDENNDIEEFENEFTIKTDDEGDRLYLMTQVDIKDDEFEKMISWFEDKGYQVNREESAGFFYEDDDNMVFPFISFLYRPND